MIKKFLLYLTMAFIIMFGYVQNRYDIFIFGFITLAWVTLDFELIDRMDSYFILKVRSNAARIIMAVLLVIAISGFFNIQHLVGMSYQSLALVIYGLSILTYVTSVLCYYMTYK